MGASEMRWPSASYCDIEDYRLYYSGKNNGNYEHGVGMIFNRGYYQTRRQFCPCGRKNYSPKIGYLTSKYQVFALNSDHCEVEVEESYSLIKGLIKKLSKQELLTN